MRLALGLQLLLLCGLSIAACTSEEVRQGKNKSRELRVGLKVQDVNGQVPPQVRCPEDVDAGEGVPLRCLAKASDGASVTLNMVQTSSEEGGVRLSTKLLETRKVETRLRRRLNVGRPSAAFIWRLDCPDLVKVEKGGRFTCEGNTVGSDFTLRATFTDDLGTLSYTVRPS